MEKSYQEVYQDNWAEIIENPDGTLNKDQIMRELADYSFLAEQASKVYCEIANLSKTTYYADTILSEMDSKYIWKEGAYDDLVNCILFDIIEDYPEIKLELKNYFDIKEWFHLIHTNIYNHTHFMYIIKKGRK